MDPVDYLRLDAFLRKTGPNPTAARSPILATHDVPVQPAWNAVLVLWDATTPDHQATAAPSLELKLGVWSYCADADRFYQRSADMSTGFRAGQRDEIGPKPLHQEPFIPFDHEDNIETFTDGETALKRFAEHVTTYAEGCGW